MTWTVKVPKGINVDFKTTNGGVRLEELAGGEIHAPDGQRRRHRHQARVYDVLRLRP